MSNPNEDLKRALAQIEELKRQNAELAAATARKISLKVSEKGAVSVYGMGRFPVTLYAQQWTTLFDMHQQIRDFIKANEPKLAVKATATAKAA